MRLKGKVAVITGGARGIGAAIARTFTREGAIVFVGDRNGLSPKTAWEEFTVHCGQLTFLELDVTRTEGVNAFVGNVLSSPHSAGRIDILVNNAGITRDATLLKMTDEEFDAVIAVNLGGVFRVARAVAPHMVAQGSGVILNASSVVAGGNFGQTNYSAAKAAVEAMTVTWARELAKKGIRVNAIAPGFTETPMTEGLPQQAKDRVVATTPLGRFATAGEIADAYCFLASDEAKFITGQILKVDGGFII